MERQLIKKKEKKIFSGGMACEILVPQPRIESRSSEVAEQCPNHQTTRGLKIKKF